MSVAETDPLSQVAAVPGVDDAATSARAAVDTLLRHRVLRRSSAEVTAEASLRAARASAALEGHDIPLDVLRAHLGDQLADGEQVPAGAGAATGQPAGQAATSTDSTDGRSLAVTLGAVRLYAELGTLSSAWERAPRQALARMHLLAGRGLLPDAVLGRPRADGQPVGAPGAAGAAGQQPPPPSALPTPPWAMSAPAVSAAEMSARLDGLTAVLTGPTKAPAIVVAAVTHGELLAIRPFGALDGIIARAAARLVLISRGLDPKALVATDVGHLELAQGGGDEAAAPVADYGAALAAYLAGGAEGVGIWVRHCAGAVALAARESLAVCEAISRA
ncbi:hypothetical protein UG55_101068 [Frankia sp. EI5c]|nr:hypothetical protein UG55_101068 [Frankia sp. EI5c]